MNKEVTILVDVGVKLYCAAMGDQIVTWWSQQDTEVKGKISFSSHSSSRTGNVI